MKARLEEVLSRILSRKYGAKIKLELEESYDEQRRDNFRTGIADSYARKRDQ